MAESLHHVVDQRAEIEPSPDKLLAIAAIDAAILSHESTAASHEAKARSLREVRAHMTGETDTASNLHGPARRDEEFISSGDAARRFSVSADTILRRVKDHNIETRGRGRFVRYHANTLRAVI